MAVNSAFDAVVEHYDEWIVKALPGYHDLFHTAVSVIPFDPESTFDVLDLGAGTGLFTYHVWSRFKNARYVLYDSAAKMLDAARRRFENSGGRFTFEEGDLRDLSEARQFDVVISSLSIHHLDDPEKQRLFSTVYKQLRRPGVFINIDQIKAPTARTGAIYWSRWLDHVRQNEADEAQLAASIRRRKQYDRDSSLIEQLHWLSDAGFTDVDCLYKFFFVGVFCAMKA
ncbi:MAG: class I SAM-dependent methyltransferase [Spirochaetales bacterium]|nr:class I SAM-dependent methyltransferase [Spirochaetales bacterium]